MLKSPLKASARPTESVWCVCTGCCKVGRTDGNKNRGGYDVLVYIIVFSYYIGEEDFIVTNIPFSPHLFTSFLSSPLSWNCIRENRVCVCVCAESTDRYTVSVLCGMAFSGTIGSHRIHTHTQTDTKGYEGFMAFTMFPTSTKGKKKKLSKNLYSLCYCLSDSTTRPF